MVRGVGVASMQSDVIIVLLKQSQIRQYFVIGRGLPSEKNPNPKLYRMRVFAKNTVLAKSKFWYHMKRQHKVRKIQGEIVSVSEVTFIALKIQRSSKSTQASSRPTVLC